MFKGPVVLIGLGVIGTPIAHKLYKAYGDRFALVAGGERKKRMQETQIRINGEEFQPRIISSVAELDEAPCLFLVCIKNYQLESSKKDIEAVIDSHTVILPLQNGISSYEYFSREFPNNTILQGFVQGPNMRKIPEGFEYSNPGAMHIGDQASALLDVAADTYSFLGTAGVDVHLEQDIKKAVWKKWMLNVAGNSVTALTGADYSNFKDSPVLQNICRKAMEEFLHVSEAEGIRLTNDDIQDILDYYTTYKGSKKTSMLEDVTNHRKTENEYLAGKIIELAKLHDIDVPIISSFYDLIKVKEWLNTGTVG